MKKFALCLSLVLSLCLCLDAGSGRSSGSFSSSRSSSSSRSFSSSSRSSGSFRSSPSRSSGSWSSKPSSSSSSRSSGGWSSKPSSSSSSSSSSWGMKSSSSWSSKPSATHSDTTVYNKAKQNGLAFSTKTDAINHFKTQNSSKYTTKFAAEPKEKPSYIPNATTVGGKTVNITYNQSHGGYGYMHPVTGAWMMYDVMSDMVMMNALMSNHGYHVGPAPVVYTSNSAVCMLTFVFAVCIIGFVIWTISRN